MATTLPLDCHACTIRILCSGDTRAYTAYFSTFFSRVGWSMASRSSPVIAWSPSRKMSSSLAMATAVSLWSPVIITGRMPAP